MSPAQVDYLTAVARVLLLRDPDGALFARVDNPVQLGAETADRAVDAAAVWAEHLGGFYDVDGVRSLLSRNGRPISRQAVSKRGGLLALTTGSGRVVYPTFQFAGGSPLPSLARVLAELPEHLIDRWTVASWLASPSRDLDGDSPARLLRTGHVDRVVAAARSWAHALAA